MQLKFPKCKVYRRHQWKPNGECGRCDAVRNPRAKSLVPKRKRRAQEQG